MYPVSERYKTAIRARARTDRVTGTLTLTDGTVLALGVQDFMSGSLTLDNQCVTGEELAFGCVYLGQAAFSLRTSLSRYAFYGAKLVLRYELQLPGGSWEAVPLGVYTVAEAERRALYVSIKAYDNILPLQSRWDGTAIQGNAYEMLAQIADGCGLELGQTAEEIAAVLEQFKKRVRIVAVVDSLKHLQKGGRLPAAVAIVGGALGIKPVLALKDGEIKLVDKGRGRPGALVAMFKQLDALGGIDPRYGYTLLYSDNKQLIAPVHHYMHQNLQLTGGRVAQLGPTIGTHVGPGVVGVVFVAKE